MKNVYNLIFGIVALVSFFGFMIYALGDINEEKLINQRGLLQDECLEGNQNACKQLSKFDSLYHEILRKRIFKKKDIPVIIGRCHSDVSVGTIHNVPEWHWIECVDTGRNYGINSEGSVTVLAYDGQNLLCRFNTTEEDSPGTKCNDGVEFLMSPLTLSLFNSQAESNKIDKEIYLNTIENLRFKVPNYLRR